MNANDRIALEIGRARLAQIIAEVQRDEALAKLQKDLEEDPRETDVAASENDN